jgi:hypothetical protein
MCQLPFASEFSAGAFMRAEHATRYPTRCFAFGSSDGIGSYLDMTIARTTPTGADVVVRCMRGNLRGPWRAIRRYGESDCALILC